jgi:hypothetical protein
VHKFANGSLRPIRRSRGRATFGFLSRYQQGATVPGGNTQINFHVAGSRGADKYGSSWFITQKRKVRILRRYVHQN